MCAIQLLSSCSFSQSCPWPCQQRESNWTEWEVRLRLVITCWLKAQMAQTPPRCSCSSNPRKSFWQADRQTQKPEKPTASWGITACRFDAETWQWQAAATELPEVQRVKALISRFHRQGLGVTAQWLGKVKKWAGCNDLKWSTLSMTKATR